MARIDAEEFEDRQSKLIFIARRVREAERVEVLLTAVAARWPRSTSRGVEASAVNARTPSSPGQGDWGTTAQADQCER
jgi:hypothetical protein